MDRRVIEKVLAEFRSSHVPAEEEMVIRDGFDDLGKDYIRDAFLGKSQDDVYRMLRDGKLGNGSSHMEELQVLEPIAVRYYLEPFLRYFGDQLAEADEPFEDEYPFFLFFFLLQTLKQKGLDVLNKKQSEALRTFVDALLPESDNAEEGTYTRAVHASLAEIKRILDGGRHASA